MNDIYLHPTSEKDFEDYYAVRSDPGDVYWNGYSKAPEKESFRKGFLLRTASARFDKPEDRRNYLIKNSSNNITVGFVQFIRKEDSVEIGYSVLTEFHGCGFATEALKIGIERAKSFGLPIIVNIRDDNVASQKVAIKNGFIMTEEYIEKEYYKAGKVKLRKYVLSSEEHYD